MGIKNRTGQVFGRLTVLSLTDKRYGSGGTIWTCRCSCGKQLDVIMNSLVTGNTVSCGCYNAERAAKDCIKRNTTHGKSRTAEYTIWGHIIARCENPLDAGYADYGGRGIKICRRWRKSFEAFLADMGTRPSSRHQIDRKRNDGGYSPSNCHWVLPKVNMNNRRSSRLLTYRGETLTMKQWSEKLGINYNTINSRFRRGATVRQALTQ